MSLDLSLTTGWAYGHLGQRPDFGYWTLGRMAEGGKVYARLADELGAALALHRPRKLVYEAPLPANRQDQDAVAKLLLGLPAIVELVCFRRRVPCYWQSCNQARSNVLGRALTGGADKIKPKIIQWATDRNWRVGKWKIDQGADDKADALLLLQYAAVMDGVARGERVSFFRHGELL